MKCIFTTIFSFLLLNLISAQEMTVQYDYNKQRNIEDTLRTKEIVFLKINGKKSSFFSQNDYLADSIVAANDKNNIRTAFRNLPESDLGYHIDKDLANHKITYFSEDFLEQQFSYEEKPNFKWKITKTKKNILGYDATLATTNYAGRDYEAYYTDKIPVHDGPYKFCGLPGLILEISDTEKKHVFKIVGISTKRNDIQLDISNRKYIMVSKPKYVEVRKNYESNPMKRMFELMNSTQIYERVDANGNVVDLKKMNFQLQKQFQEEFKRKNNIEIQN